VKAKLKSRVRTLEELWAIEDEFPLAFAPDPVISPSNGGCRSQGITSSIASNAKPTATAGWLPISPAAKRDMKKKLTAEEWWNGIVEYERTHEIAFAYPRALLEARMIAEMDKARRPHRRDHRNGVSQRRKAVAR